MRTALETGYRHISLVTSDQDDLRACGVAIGESDVLREEVFLSMRLPSRDHARTQEAVESSLETLGVDYVDLLLMEKRTADDNTAEEPVYVETWVEMQRLVEARRVRSLGVSGFSRSDLETLLADERCTVSIHPYLRLSREVPLLNTETDNTLSQPNIPRSLHPLPKTGSLQHLQRNPHNGFLKSGIITLRQPIPALHRKGQGEKCPANPSSLGSTSRLVRDSYIHVPGTDTREFRIGWMGFDG